VTRLCLGAEVWGLFVRGDHPGAMRCDATRHCCGEGAVFVLSFCHAGSLRAGSLDRGNGISSGRCGVVDKCASKVT
jgi:hypothetical protein